MHKKGKKGASTLTKIRLKRLQRLRQRIDQIDVEVLQSINIRLKMVRQIGCLKRELGLPVFQRQRWQQLLKDRVEIAEHKFSLNKQFSQKLFTVIHGEALRLQRILGRRGGKSQ